MTASETPSKERAEARNFQRRNLRGKSFKGQDLSGADFSEADLRGTNFTGAKLQGAKFTGAKCGLQKRWVVLLTILSWIMAAISGLFSILTGDSVSDIFYSNPINQIKGCICLIVIVIFVILTIQKGIRVGAFTVLGISAVFLVVTFAFAFLISGADIKIDAAFQILRNKYAFPNIDTVKGEVGNVVEGISVEKLEEILRKSKTDILGLTAIGGLGANQAGEIIVLLTGTLTGAFAFTGAFAVSQAGGIIFLFIGAFAGILTGILTEAVTVTVTVAVAVAVTVTYIAWRAMKKDPRDAWVRRFAIAFAALGGTSFRSADLTDANFSSARLKSTDMRKATLTGVRWYGADMIDRVRPGYTYLQSTQIRQWLIGQGVDKNFDGQKLQGINFEGADLTNASFIDTNLNEANLQNADLSRAKLVQTQLDKTDFTGATLTGAFIEDWGITSNTKLDGVRCEYVFMHLPTDKDPDPYRKPDNRSEVFEDSDFADFIKPIFDTLDLYHNQGVDPRAIAISWKELAENNPDAQLKFASMEVKGEDNLLLRLKTSPNADLSQLSAEYFETYNQIKALAEEDAKKLIAEKDNRIQALETMVNTALKRPGFYAETYNHQGDNEMAGEQRKIEISGGTINNSGAGAFSLGDIHGTVANTINKLQPSSDSEESGIKELLTQLQKAVDDPQLSEDDKKQVLDQIQALAEAGQNPQDETMQKKAERAVGFLEVIAKGVEPASKLAKASTNVLPKIIAFFV